jgi:hypothetical protein
MEITFAIACNNEKLLRANFLSSPCLKHTCVATTLIQRDFASAALAYNDALDRSTSDLVAFVHQDLFFPENWISRVLDSLDLLNARDPSWGVLGCFGVSAEGTRYGRVYSAGLGTIGTPISQPTCVQTLDEIVLIMRKSSGLRFDNTLPGFHFYGADICMQANERGMRSYAIPAFCVHNTQMPLVLPSEFYRCYREFKRKWRYRLPVYTSCITVTKFDRELRLRRLREAYITHIARRKPELARLADPRSALELGIDG